MKPVIVLVGRPNVGKSTLFNRLTKTRDAIVANVPGLTRDRHYGHGQLGKKPYLVVDTGGVEPMVTTRMIFAIEEQTVQAIAEASAVIFIVDARSGITPQDKLIAQRLRQAGCPIWIAVNKAEGQASSVVTAEFFELGLSSPPKAISASHGQGVSELINAVLESLPITREEKQEEGPQCALIGRPNVGKSTLVNAILGENRVVVFDQPGTTRDSISVRFAYQNRHYTLIDTAGIRRAGKRSETIETFSVIKAMQSVESANVAVLVLDATQDIADQDARLARFILESGRAVVVAVNKWDAIDTEQRHRIKDDIAHTLSFLRFATVHYISALKKQGITALFRSIEAAYRAAMIKMATPKLTRALECALQQQPPPRKGRFRPKLRYAHQGGSNPPVVVIHGNALETVPTTYWRYLEQAFMKTFQLNGTPLRVQYKLGSNPFEK